MPRIYTLIFYIFFLSALLIGCQNEKKYSAQVWNKSNSPVAVEKILVDSKEIYSKKTLLAPQEKVNYTLPALSFIFQSASLNYLTLIISTTTGVQNKVLHCTISDPNHSGCNVPISITADFNVTCVCDSYSDFN